MKSIIFYFKIRFFFKFKHSVYKNYIQVWKFYNYTYKSMVERETLQTNELDRNGDDDMCQSVNADMT